MAEFTAVIGATAAVVQLLDYARRTRGCIPGLADGSRTLDDLAGQVNDMKNILACIRAEASATHCKATIQRCSDKLTRLSELVVKLKAAKKNGFWARTRLLRMWLQKEQEIESLMNDIFDREFGLLKMYFLLLVSPKQSILQPTLSMSVCEVAKYDTSFFYPARSFRGYCVGYIVSHSTPRNPATRVQSLAQHLLGHWRH